MGKAETITHALAAAPVVPLIDSEDGPEALAISRALVEGGLGVHEVVLRRPGALEAMGALAGARGRIERETGRRPIVGAGTVLTLDQARAARDGGAEFIVSPGFVEEIAAWCMDEGLPVFPGTATAGEVQRAFAMGLRAVKFFPAALAGGPAMLKALSSVFGDMRFMPTGGISAANLPEYLALPGVIACGGSWLTPQDRIEAGDWAAVTGLAREALEIARKARG